MLRLTSATPSACGVHQDQADRLRRGTPPVVRAASIRHVAIVIAAIVAWRMRRHPDVGLGVFCALGAGAVMNAAMAALADSPRTAGWARWLSSSVGAATWAALVGSTGGVASPMVAGFWLEIALSPLVVRTSLIPVATSIAAAALWAQQAIFGAGMAFEPLCVETAFLFATGALTYYASERFARRERTLRANADDLSQRLRRLERDLDEAQKVGRLGEHVARLAHATKGAVHSLRGFAKLIELPLLESPLHRRAFEGLRLAIDRLDEIARITLRRSPDEPQPARGTSAASLARTLEEVIDEIRPLHAGVRWLTRVGDGPRGVSLPARDLREVMRILVQNAVEASGTAGEIALELEADANMLRIVVRDRGPGLSPRARHRLLVPGATTKPEGSGFGLFLARRLVESGGGQLTAESPVGGGAVFAVRLPIQEG